MATIQIKIADVIARLEEKQSINAAYALDRCPFCGEPAQITWSFTPRAYYGECTDILECGISGPHGSTPAAAQLAWNTRAPAARSQLAPWQLDRLPKESA